MRSHGAGPGSKRHDRVAQAGGVDPLHDRGEAGRALGMAGAGVVQQELRVDRQQDRHAATLSPRPPARPTWPPARSARARPPIGRRLAATAMRRLDTITGGADRLRVGSWRGDPTVALLSPTPGPHARPRPASPAPSTSCAGRGYRVGAHPGTGRRASRRRSWRPASPSTNASTCSATTCGGFPRRPRPSARLRRGRHRDIADVLERRRPGLRPVLALRRHRPRRRPHGHAPRPVPRRHRRRRRSSATTSPAGPAPSATSNASPCTPTATATASAPPCRRLARLVPPQGLPLGPGQHPGGQPAGALALRAPRVPLRAHRAGRARTPPRRRTGGVSRAAAPTPPDRPPPRRRAGPAGGDDRGLGGGPRRRPDRRSRRAGHSRSSARPTGSGPTPSSRWCCGPRACRPARPSRPSSTRRCASRATLEAAARGESPGDRIFTVADEVPVGELTGARREPGDQHAGHHRLRPGHPTWPGSPLRASTRSPSRSSTPGRAVVASSSPPSSVSVPRARAPSPPPWPSEWSCRCRPTRCPAPTAPPPSTRRGSTASPPPSTSRPSAPPCPSPCRPHRSRSNSSRAATPRARPPSPDYGPGPTRTVLTNPYAPVDSGAWIDSGLLGELGDQYTAGTTTLLELLRARPDERLGGARPHGEPRRPRRPARPRGRGRRRAVGPARPPVERHRHGHLRVAVRDRHRRRPDGSGRGRRRRHRRPPHPGHRPRPRRPPGPGRAGLPPPRSRHGLPRRRRRRPAPDPRRHAGHVPRRALRHHGHQRSRRGRTPASRCSAR